MIKLCCYDDKECIKWLKFVQLNYVFVLWNYRFKLLKLSRFVTVFEKQSCLLLLKLSLVKIMTILLVIVSEQVLKIHSTDMDIF